MGKITVITGGTSGIGRGIAEKILAESAKTDRIFVTYGHDEKKALSFQESLPEEKRSQVTLIKADMSSYEEMMVFVEKLKKEQVSCEIRENDFPGQKEERKAPAKLFESFTFLCIVLAVVCNLIDYLVDGHMGWAWFVTAGAFCTWLMVSVAYVKRRNLLKNEMWQLVIVTVAGVLWDVFTGAGPWIICFLWQLLR